jgi:hypothetical protein
MMEPFSGEKEVHLPEICSPSHMAKDDTMPGNLGTCQNYAANR